MTKQIVYNGRKYTLRHCTNNVIKEYENSLSIYKNDWYNEANIFAQNIICNYELIQICGVIASLSPLKSWSHNKTLAMQFLINGAYSGHVSLFNKKAIDILNLKEPNKEQILKILGGEKIQNFFLNIYEPANNENITIDRHAVNIALNCLNYNGGVNYTFFKNVYINASKKLNVSVISLQSTTWQNWRSKHGNKKTKKL